MELAGVGKRLRELREKELGIDTLELAARLKRLGVKGASNASVSRYESGKRTPPADYIWAVAHLTGVSTDWILTGTGPRERTTQDDADLFQAGAALAVKKMMAAIWEILETTGLSADGAERELTERERRELENMERVTRDLQQLQGVRRPKQQDAGG